MRKLVTDLKEAGAGDASGWFVYVIRASDESLYTGITTDVARRFREHATPAKGARYFRGREPLEIVLTEQYPDRSRASIREAEIKKMSRKEKLMLIEKGILPADFKKPPRRPY